MKIIVTLSLLLLALSTSLAQTTAKVFADGKATSVVVPNAETYTFEFPITPLVASKAFSSPINVTNTLAYRMYIAGDESLGLGNVHWSDETQKGQKSWKKFAKAGGVLKAEVAGSKVHDVFRILKQRGWPSKDVELKVWVEAAANLNGDVTTLSEGTIKVPASLKSGLMANQNAAVLKSFQSGSYSDQLRDSKLNSAIESYMEKKWPGENVTTVTGRSLVYTDASKTKFKFEAYYITQKNGKCKYNSCYGNGTNYGNRYAITFFNSMNAEKTLDCGVATKVKNR